MFSQKFRAHLKNNRKAKSFVWLLLFLSFSLISCEMLQKTAREYFPDITLRSVNFHSLDMQGIDLKFNYNIHNKVSFPINMNSLAFKVYADNKQVANVRNAQQISVPAGGDSTLEFIHRIQFKDFIESVTALAKQDKFQMKLDGVLGFFLNQTLGSIDVPINAQKELPVPKLPKIKVSDFRFVKSDLNIFNPKANFNLKLLLENPNIFPLNIAKLDYKFNVEGSSLFDGIVKSLNVESGKTSELNLPITLQGGELVRLLPKLKDFSNLDYKFVSDMFLNFAGQEVKIPLSYPAGK